MKRGKLPESQSKRRKRLAQDVNVWDALADWDGQYRELWERVASAFKKRLESECAYTDYELLQAQWFTLPARPAYRKDLYYTHQEPLAFWRAMQRMQDNRLTDYEELIAFLERDPYTFRSGYCKEKILRRLKKVTLTDQQKTRLQAMLLVQVQKTPRREVREYCRLAIVLDQPELRRELELLEERGGTWAGWMLATMRLQSRD